MRSSRFKVRTQSVALGDDSDLRWVSLIPEGAIFAHGMEWRFDSDVTDPDNLRFTFDDAVESLQRWLADFAPAVAIEHDKNGTAAGYLRRIRVLTAAEAAGHGIAQPAPRMIYGGLDLTSPRWAEAFDAGEVPYVSPNIRAWAGTERDSAPAYPFAIGEVSFVTIPQIKAQQVPVAQMRGVALSEGVKMTMTKEELTGYCADMGMDPAKIEELIGKLFGAAHEEAHALQPDLAEEAEVAALTKIAEGAAEAAKAEAVEEAEEKKEDEALLSENGRLKRELAAAKRAFATASVRQRLGARKVSTATESLLTDAFLRGGDKFEALLSDLGPAPKSAPAAAPVAARTVAPVARVSADANLAECLTDYRKFDALSDDDQWARICELADKENIAHWQAASWIRFSRMPDSVRERRASGLSK